MNATLSTHVDEHHHHPPSVNARNVGVRRVALVDRVALHLGLALITWSRRPGTRASRPAIDWHARNQRALERAERERQWALSMYLNHPRR